jgi:hypothetical protein
MITLTPSGSPQETSAALGLFAILGDKEAAKKRLDELIEVAQSALAAREDASKLRDEAKSHRQAAEVSAAEAAALNSHNRRLSTEMGQREQALIKRDKEITAREATHAAAVKDHEAKSAARESAVTNREKKVAERELRLSELEKLAQTARDEFQGRSEAIKAAFKTAVG